ncbi:MAG: DNA internalization-related competence protein ComEC/Rec2 [Comamonadaceae bacterium]|nr:MAG: DNA internalization-related competence protein ComEC/Rec2 [Comamonadaceae bacterium]
MAPALAGAVLGPALQLQQAALWPAAVYGLILATVLVPWAWIAIKKIPCSSFIPVLLGAAALAFSLCGLRAVHFMAQGLDPALEGRDIALVGVVAAMPQRNELGQRFRLDVESARADGQEVVLPPKISLGWYGGEDSPLLRAGERWQMTVRLKAPHGNLNPHGFDYELWLWEQGIQATGYVRAGPHGVPEGLRAPPQRIGSTWAHPVERARQDVRAAIFERVADRKNAGLLAALVVGDQNAIDRADWDIFRATGVAHLMSISGLHVTMFAWAAALAVGWLWRRSQRLCLAWPAQHAALAGGVLLAGGYALFSGWGVPSQRTVWMLATLALLRLSGRRWPWPLLWLLACAVVVSFDPWALAQAGFWLSFVAVGVLFATDSGAPRVRPAGTAGRFGILLREQMVVTVALTPLTLLLFGQVSIVGMLANLVAIPWITLLVTPLALAGVLLPPLWDAAAWAVQALGWFLQQLAAWSFATVSTAAAPLWAGVAGVLGGLVLAMRLPLPARLLGLPLMLPVLLWQAPRPAAGEFELLAADIGQGNAVIVRTAGHTLVYDAGPRYSAESDAGHRVLVPLLRAFGERVDTLVVSHRDSDHSGGAAAVLAMQPQAKLLSSIEDGHELQALRRAVRCQAGQRWQWNGVDFAVLHPQPSDYHASGRANALSCVLRISNGRQSALLAGDIELAQEERLVEQAAGALKADVLLVPHHGSKTSSSEAFLDAVQPKWALAQAGYRNRFGHPAAPVVERYLQRGASVVASPRCGAARWSSAQPLHVACERDKAPRYWHHRVPQ